MRLFFKSNMITKLDEIYDYIARELSAPITAKKKIKEIRDNISILKMFPESGFDADEKFGKVIDSNNKRREITLKRDYIVLYFIDNLGYTDGITACSQTNKLSVSCGLF